MAEQPAPAPRAGIVNQRQEQVLADIRASLAARDLEYAKAVDPEACALLVRMAAEYGFELSFLASAENFTARLTDMRPPYGGSRAVLHFQSWNARWSGDPGGRGFDVSEVAAWLAAYRAHPAWHPDSLYDDMKARMRSAEVSGPSETTPRHAQASANSSENGPDTAKGAQDQQARPAVDFPNPVAPDAQARSAARPPAAFVPPWTAEIRGVLADGGFPGTPVEWQHLCDEHGADPATVARDAPTPDLAGRIHDAAHLYPGVPWGEVVVRAWAEAWWEARQWQYRERPEITAQIEVLRTEDTRQQALTRDMTETGQREPWVMEDPAEWRVFFREVLGRDMPRNAEHEARLHQLDAAELLTRDMWTNGPDGTSYLHGFDADELAAERDGISFPQLHELRYLQLSAGRREPAVQVPVVTGQATASSSRNGPDNTEGAEDRQPGPEVIQVQPSGEMVAYQAELSARMDPEADPCTVTEHFVTSIGPTLHYTLTSTAGHVLDYSRDPDGNVGAQIKAGNRWIDLPKQGPRYQAVIQGVREYEARNPDLADYNNPPAASAEPGPAKTADRYVVARINKTYRTLGERPGPQHVGKTFVPYDDRHLSKQAAEESAEASNDRYRPSLHGKTYIAVRAEPVPGTNKFRNLDHPSLTSKVHAAGPKVGTAAARSAQVKEADLQAGLDFPGAPVASPPAGSARPAASRTAATPVARSGRQVSGPGRRR